MLDVSATVKDDLRNYLRRAVEGSARLADALDLDRSAALLNQAVIELDGEIATDPLNGRA